MIARATIGVAGYGVRVGIAGNLRLRQMVWTSDRRYVKSWRHLRVGLRLWLFVIECGFEFDRGEWEYDLAVQWGDSTYERRRNLIDRWSDGWVPF